MSTGQELKDVCSECASRAEEKYANVSQPGTSSQDSSVDILNSSTVGEPPKNPSQSWGGIIAESLFSVKEDHDESPLGFIKLGRSSSAKSKGPSKEDRLRKVPPPIYSDQGEMMVTPQPLKKPKRPHTQLKEGQQGLSCANCQAYISWGGSTPVGNIERHVKLHASREQFSCSFCHISFNRKYMAKQHIEQSHQGMAEIIDHEPELRSEYDALWLKCFPQVDYENYKSKKKEYAERKKKFEYENLMKSTGRGLTEERSTTPEMSMGIDIFSQMEPIVKEEEENF